MNIQIIQTGIKLQSFVVFTIMPSLKQIGSQVTHDTGKRIFHKIMSAEFPPLNIIRAQ